ncbi:MAG: DNA-binding protein [Candidatus Obscuribacterales bacterium]|nr:DNA-binding protein [Candidatus Obscuribacterales bacterium]
MSILVKRLKPDSDVYKELKALVDDHKIEAAVVLSLVGSLKEGSLRFANQENASKIKGPLEIVSATGTLGLSGLHVHASFSDSQGHTSGGHLMPGCLVYTTCEIVLHDFSNEWKFERILDVTTGYPELVGVSLHLK